jgi:serine/threonine protein phosphatase PrpC
MGNGETMSIKWISASLTNVGTVRKVNEDACAAMPGRGLWVVADGMGGHDAGDVASQMIVAELSKLAIDGFVDAVDQIEDCLELVNHRLLAIAAQRGEGSIVGSTAVLLLACQTHIACLWVGDSRAYCLRDGTLSQLSEDHSQVAEMVAAGLLSAEEAESHPDANVITRAVGVSEQFSLDIDLFPIGTRDRYLLCSDGLNKELSDAEIADHLSYGDCADACERLVQTALERNCRDNISVIVVDFSETTEQGKAG